MFRIVMLLFAMLSCACSARVEYSSTDQVTVAGAVNINAASADDLEKLPHVGRKTAEAIVQFRSENGPFRRPEHLLLIRGVSEQRFVELRPFICTE
jgi:competence ComEA-like helix-hairpin-helix protein